MTDPAPCPLCGNNLFFNITRRRLRCLECGLEGPEGPRLAEHICDHAETWNDFVSRWTLASHWKQVHWRIQDLENRVEWLTKKLEETK